MPPEAPLMAGSRPTESAAMLACVCVAGLRFWFSRSKRWQPDAAHKSARPTTLATRKLSGAGVLDWGVG